MRFRDVLITGAVGAVCGGAIALTVLFTRPALERRLEAERAAFEQKFGRVAVGDTKEAVRALLGEPTRAWPPGGEGRGEVDGITSATPGREIWDYDVAARTYFVAFGPNPRWDDEFRVVGKHPAGDDPDDRGQ